MGAAGWGLTDRRVTGGPLPALLALTASVHALSVSAAVCRLAAPLVNAQDGGDPPTTAPPAIWYTVRGGGRVESVNKINQLILSGYHFRTKKKPLKCKVK